jgi:hypothetical protein
MTPAKQNGNVTISGPGVERSYNGKITPSVALSAAQGFAMNAAVGSTFYVREDGRAVFYVERHADAAVTFVVPA